MLAGGGRYHAEIVPTDDTIARMYESAIEWLRAAGLLQYEISNFAQPGGESRHNLRYWERHPYLGLGLDASSMLYAADSESGFVLRSINTDGLKVYVEGPPAPETAWLSAERRHEEAWFLGLRLNRGVLVARIREEFGNQRVADAIETVMQLCERDLLAFDGESVRLTAQGRMLSNDVFQEFLESPFPEESFAER